MHEGLVDISVRLEMFGGNKFIGRREIFPKRLTDNLQLERFYKFAADFLDALRCANFDIE